MRDKFVETLIEVAKDNSNIELMTGDLGFGVLRPFWEELPNQFTNAGIAEQNMTSVAAGMALEGKVVYTYSIGNFPTLRCLEQIRNDCAYHKANVKIVCVGGGFAYGPLGMSHHATEDIAVLRALPNVSVFCPGDLVEAKIITKKIAEYSGTCYLRLGRGGEIQIHDSSLDFELGDFIEVNKGKDILILSTGAILDQVKETVESLVEKGLSVQQYSVPMVSPLNESKLKELANSFKYIVTIEEHNLNGGFGSAVSEVISTVRGSGILLPIGINNEYVSDVGSQNYLREVTGLDASSIVNRICKFIEGEKL